MRDFTEGVILQDYAKAESLESGKLLSKKTPGSLTLSFKDYIFIFFQISKKCANLADYDYSN